MWIPGSVVRVLYDYEPTSKNAIKLKRGEYIVVMPVKNGNNGARQNSSTMYNNPWVDYDAKDLKSNTPIWVAGSKITGETGYFPSTYVELIKLEDTKTSPTIKKSTAAVKPIKNNQQNILSSPSLVVTSSPLIKKKLELRRKMEVEKNSNDSIKKRPNKNRKNSRKSWLEHNNNKSNRKTNNNKSLKKFNKTMKILNEKNFEIDSIVSESSINTEESQSSNEAGTNVNTKSARKNPFLNNPIALKIVENHTIAWVKHCVEVAIYAIDRTYLNLALNASSQLDLNDINNEKCFEKLEIEDELQHVLTNSFFNKSRNLHETIGVIINLIEKEKEIDFSSYTFSTKPSNRVKIGNEVIDIFWKSSSGNNINVGSDVINHLQLLCECRSLLGNRHDLSIVDKTDGDKKRKRMLLYEIINNKDGDAIMDNSHVVKYVSHVQKLCRKITPAALVFIYKALKDDFEYEVDIMGHTNTFSIACCPIWSFRICKILLKAVLENLGGEVAMSLRSMLDYGKPKSRNISKNQKLALQNNMDLILKDIAVVVDDVDSLDNNNNNNINVTQRLSLLNFLNRSPLLNQSLYKMNEQILILINHVVSFYKYQSIF